MHYRRAFIPGGIFFFTLVTEQRKPLFATAESVEVLRGALRAVRATRPFQIDAMVVMPDHLHCIWTLPPGDADFATSWRLVKTWFTKHCDPVLRTVSSRARVAKGERGLWQHRYWEHAIRDEADFIRHVDYIHFNPVKHGHVATPVQWPYSSFHRYVAAGIYPADWGGGEVEITEVGGE